MPNKFYLKEYKRLLELPSNPKFDDENILRLIPLQVKRKLRSIIIVSDRYLQISQDGKTWQKTTQRLSSDYPPLISFNSNYYLVPSSYRTLYLLFDDHTYITWCVEKVNDVSFWLYRIAHIWYPDIKESVFHNTEFKYGESYIWKPQSKIQRIKYTFTD